MIYNEFKGKELSMLGFGCMRLPLREDKSVDVAQVEEMTEYAFDHGINYFDTAYPYHGGKSEVIIGEILKNYPRDSFNLASKYPGHQIASEYHPDEVFEEQLKKCQVDYFDFYLMHNVNEHSIEVYEDPKWNILPYFAEQKKNGRIKHLGFSTHARPETIKGFLDYCKSLGIEMEFCQIQLNYVDWTLQYANEKVDILNEYGVGIWVMEPIRGGALADDCRSAFRFLQDIPGIKVVLSGMSNLQQMKENIETFDVRNPLNEEERAAILEKAERLKNAVPCTRCRYCTDGCPMGLDIPVLIAGYNDAKFGGSVAYHQLDALPDDKLPSACIGCGSCAAICPQNIDIPSVLADFADMYDKSEKWADICKRREEEARRLREGK